MYVLFFSGYPLAMPAVAELSRSVRSAGGNHTLTRARQKVRVVPHGSVYTPEPSSRIRSACLCQSVYFIALNIIGILHFSLLVAVLVFMTSSTS